jgi:hypothetical protein
MGRPSRMSVLKRKREREKAEKAAQKRMMRDLKEPKEEAEPERVATREDLEGYGVVGEEDEAEN